MKLQKLFALNLLAVTLAACGSGDINLNPSNNVVDSNNPVTNYPGSGSSSNSGTNFCASYELGGQLYQGTVNGANCLYSVAFVSDTRPLTNDLTLASLANNGVHIFSDSLFVGEDVDANAAAAGAIVPQAGKGPILFIEAGAKLAFSNPVDYIRIARGSQIFAEGTATNPIIISAKKDLVDNAATENDRGLWGGLQILGNGLTNKCATPTNCHITSEGRPGTYGGNDNSESSGVLKYVVVKHAGYEVVDGNELNGITFYAVGSGTVVDYVQTYTTADDGFEMFGGAVNLKHVVAVNVGDDSYDFADGWVGNIQFALALHTSGANRCIEADNTGEGRADNIAPLTFGRISNHTCITSGVKQNAGDHPSGKGDSEGPLMREGVQFALYNSIITSNAPAQFSQECFDIEDSEGPETIKFINDGISVASGNIIACSESTKQKVHADNTGFNTKTWLTSNNNVVVDSSVTGALPVTVIKDLATNPRAYITASSFQDANLAPVTVNVFDVTKLSEVISTTSAPVAGSNTFFEPVDFIGAVKEGQDWTQGWTVGLSQ